MTPKRLADLRAFLLEKYLLVREFAGTTAVQDLVGTSGAALSLGAVAAGVGQDSRLARIREAHGEKLNRAAVARMIDESAPLSAAERRTVWPCLSPTRSIIFVHGALIYEALLEVLNLESFTVNAYGMKLGGLLARRLATDE